MPSTGASSRGPVPMTFQLGAQVSEVVAMRRWVSDALTDLTDDVVDDVLLVATELVTNAYDHGRAPREMRLQRTCDSHAIHIEVDDSSAALPVLGFSTIGHARGRGLIIVDRLSTEWGATNNAVGKTVWADISCAGC